MTAKYSIKSAPLTASFVTGSNSGRAPTFADSFPLSGRDHRRRFLADKRGELLVLRHRRFLLRTLCKLRLLCSRLLFLAELFETWIIPQRIEHGIEPEQRGSQRTRRKSASVRYREQFL
jgi:hypothetical protein